MQLAVSEATSAWGWVVFIERYVSSPKHIEYSVGDTHGNIVHFFEGLFVSAGIKKVKKAVILY